MHVIRSRSQRSPRQRPVALFMVAAIALVMAAGCGSDEKTGASPSPAPTGPARMSPVPSNVSYNAADVVFSQDLLANLREATEFAKLAKDRATNAEIKKLATKAEQDRQPGVILLKMWLEKMGQPMPATAPPAGQGGSLVKADEKAALSQASGEAFDRLFLQLMVKLNDAANVLVNGEQWSGINGPLISLSHEVSDHTKAELDRLHQLLGS